MSRDLTSRLTFMAVLVTIGVLASLAAREEFIWEDMDTGGLLAIGILLGLIYAEQYQQWRDRATEHQPATQARDSDAGMR